MYGLAVDAAWAHERRELLLGEGEELSDGPSSVNSSIKLGAYTGRLANLNLAGINNSIPNLPPVYLDTPLVGPTLEPLEYVPSTGRPGKPSRYHPTSLQSKYSRRCPPPQPPPYHTHPQMHPPTGRAQSRRVLKATGPEQNSKIAAPRGEPLVKFWPQGLERPNPFTHAYEHRGGELGSDWVPETHSKGPRNFHDFANRGEPLAKI